MKNLIKDIGPSLQLAVEDYSNAMAELNKREDFVKKVLERVKTPRGEERAAGLLVKVKESKDELVTSFMKNWGDKL